jgi:signal peptidase II
MSPFWRAGLLAAALALALDQAVKLWLLHGYDIAARGAVRLAPFFDLVLAWNKGISYGWFQTETAFGQAVLLAIKVAAVLGLSVWLARAHSRLVAVALGLIIGGAIGNAIDRALYGAVMDFAYFHLRVGDWRFDWYVFNLADVAIVAGVIGLLYDSLTSPIAAKAP